DQIDATRFATLEGAGETVVVSPRRMVRPGKAGSTTLVVTAGGVKASVSVVTAAFAAAVPVDYVAQVQPAMSKMGCNQGTCHGGAQGKNGFQLSLRGYDPIFDHRALTDDLEGRRINRSAPDRSLMLLKATGDVPHIGGVLTSPGETYYRILRDWIAAGAKLDLASSRVVKLEVVPAEVVVPLPGMKQQLAVYATYADGKRRDVTAEAFVDSSNTEVAEVDKTALVAAVRRGETAMLARYEGSYAAATIVVMGDRTGFAWDAPAPTDAIDPIDVLVYKKLQKVKVKPSGLCTDEEFVRRLHLDLIGLPPTPEELQTFLADARPSAVKRSVLVDQLLGGPEYVESWTNRWADLLQVNRKFLGTRGAWAYRNWIRSAVASNMPYDEFVREIVTASGSTIQNPPASYYKILRDPGDTMETTTQLFLAVRFNCNKCHDHPFERWTQDQYYNLAAYFSQVGRKDSPNSKERIGGSAVEGALAEFEVVYDVGGGDVTHVRTGQIAPPKFPYDHADLAPADASRRAQLAQWLTSKDNQYFAKSYVNRLWSYLLGVGLIEPVDDIRAGNPPSNPELLDLLTKDFIASGFDVQKLLRRICNTRTYQHSIQTNPWNDDDVVNYSHALARRLPAETLYDAIHHVLGVTPKLPDVPAGFRASQLPDSNVSVGGGFLELFGKPARESACECERSSGMMLGPILNLVNGPVIGEAVRDPNGRLAKLVAGAKDDAAVVRGVFLALLSREPTPAETVAGVAALKSYVDEVAKLQAELKTYEATLLPAA
ncbi:MAG: DUF1549 domain-containing protein, partial [Planctomycetia bacterium]